MLFPAPLSPTSATVSPGASSRSSPSRTTSGRAGYENETPSIRTGTAAGLGGAPDASRAALGRGVQQREDPLRHRGPVRARVVLGPEPPDRQVQLRREHEHGQPGLEADPAVHEPHADGHGDERDAERRSQLEHRPGEEARAKRLHRRAPVALAHVRDRGRLLAAAVERAQGRQPAHDVEEVRRQQPQREPALTRASLGVAPDQPHEHRHERQRQQQDQRGLDVDPGDPAEDDERHEAREHDLREVAREVRLERVDPLDGCGRDLAGLDAVQRSGLGSEPARHQRHPQLGEHRRRRAPAGDLERPRARSARGEGEREQHELGPHVAQRARRETPARRSRRAATPGRGRALP